MEKLALGFFALLSFKALAAEDKQTIQTHADSTLARGIELVRTLGEDLSDTLVVFDVNNTLAEGFVDTPRQNAEKLLVMLQAKGAYLVASSANANIAETIQTLKRIKFAPFFGIAENTPVEPQGGPYFRGSELPKIPVELAQNLKLKESSKGLIYWQERVVSVSIGNSYSFAEYKALAALVALHHDLRDPQQYKRILFFDDSKRNIFFFSNMITSNSFFADDATFYLCHLKMSE